MRLLLIEDDLNIRRVLERAFKAENWSIDSASDGTDGLWRFNEAHYDAVVLDLLLPGINGYEVCREIRATGSLVPILVLTAKSGDYDQIDLLDLGADDFVTKPVPTDVLIARLRALVRRNSGRAVNTIEFNNLKFDTENRHWSLCGETLNLTAKESEVLLVLLEAAPGFLTRQEVLHRGWGMDFDGDPGTVDVYLRRLRKKVGQTRIETVRGVGFRLC